MRLAPHRLFAAILFLAGVDVSGARTAAAGPPAGEVLVHGRAAALSADAAAAWVDALEFVLGELDELGEPVRFPPATRAALIGRLVGAFPQLPPAVQFDLAAARSLFDIHRSQWPTLPSGPKRIFAYQMLAVAYGEEIAARALGLDPGGPFAGGSAALAGPVPGAAGRYE